MPSVSEGVLTFDFPDHWLATKYEHWAFYIGKLQGLGGGTKLVDILAIDPDVCCWIIEVKDYRTYPRTKPSEIHVEIARKVRDNLAGLVVARLHADARDERSMAEAALRCPSLRVVLHLEQRSDTQGEKLRSISPANVSAKLRQELRGIDPNPLVMKLGLMDHVAWTVADTSSDVTSSG